MIDIRCILGFHGKRTTKYVPRDEHYSSYIATVCTRCDCILEIYRYGVTIWKRLVWS
jgi:hypothetical protein